MADVLVDRTWFYFFFSSRRRHTRLQGDWSSDVCSSDLFQPAVVVCEFQWKRGRDRQRPQPAESLGNDFWPLHAGGAGFCKRGEARLAESRHKRFEVSTWQRRFKQPSSCS